MKSSGENSLSIHGLSCDLCAGKEFRVLEEDPPFRVLRCLQCSLTFVHPVPEGAALAEHYDGDYYREWIGPGRKSRAAMWRRRLDRVERTGARGRILDVGCGEGVFLSQAAKRGWETWGTELSPYAARHASSSLGGDIFCGELYDASFPGHFFDVVTLWHVLEHVRQPARYLAEIRRVIRPGGLLVVAVPNVDDLFMQAAYRIVRGRPQRLFSKEDREIHLTHFSARTIAMYLERTGFSRIRIGPDFGIVEPGKRLINAAAAACGYLGGLTVCNSLEVHARPAGS
jgi:2-polyprenyl-3-methyl-5-hydroxy-6-metoxy-1,4-benzoquinol methylase